MDSSILGLSILDIGVMVLYFGIIIYIGVRASFQIKKEEDYFLGGRKFGKLVSTFASFGQATSADGPAGVATTTFINGASGIWSSLLMLWATPIYWITSPWLRRLRILTMGDFYLERYGSKRMAAAYALVGTIGMMGLLSVGYIAVTKTALAMTAKNDTELTLDEQSEKQLAEELFILESKDFRTLAVEERDRLDELRNIDPRSIFSHLNESVIIWSVCFLVLIYTAMGGLEAAFYTDMLQGVFIIILSFILVPFAWQSINQIFGGEGSLQALTHLHQRLPENIFEIFGSPTAIDFTWYFILTAAIVSGVTVVTQPNQLVTSGAAKDESAARVGFVTGTFMKRVVTIMWGVLGIAAILLYSGKITNPDLVWGHATKDLLDSLNLGLVGLMLASMMAALMSTADTLMVTVSGLIVHNLYRPFTKVKTERHYIWAGRIAGGLYLIGAALVTTQFDGILQILKFIWEFFVIFAAAFWLGLKWRRANRQGAWASIISTFSLFYFLPLLLPVLFPSLRNNVYLLKQTKPEPIERVYMAKFMDVEQRQKDMEAWEVLEEKGLATGEKPRVIQEGEQITKYYTLPQRSVFWSKGLKTAEQGVEFGSGYIYLELVLLDRMGLDLEQNSYALNETIRLLIRLLFPFAILLLVSRLTAQNNEERQRLFFNKMRIRVHPDGPEADQRALALGLKNPAATSEVLVFRNTEWEFYKWNTKDRVGFLVSWLVVLLILGILYLSVTLGG